MRGVGLEACAFLLSAARSAALTVCISLLSGLLAACEAANVGTLIRLPYASGLLTGKVSRAYLDGLSDGDHRKFNVAGAAFDKVSP